MTLPQSKAPLGRYCQPSGCLSCTGDHSFLQQAVSGRRRKVISDTPPPNTAAASTEQAGKDHQQGASSWLVYTPSSSWPSPLPTPPLQARLREARLAYQGSDSPPRWHALGRGVLSAAPGCQRSWQALKPGQDWHHQQSCTVYNPLLPTSLQQRQPEGGEGA